MITKTLKCSLTMLVLLAGLAPGAPAQSRERVTFTAPFAFYVGTRELPAGEYTIQFSPVVPAFLVVLDASRVPRATVIGIPAQAARPSERASLVFRRYGTLHFLASVWVPGSATGEELLRSGMERDLAKTAKAVEVTLVERSRESSPGR